MQVIKFPRFHIKSVCSSKHESFEPRLYTSWELEEISGLLRVCFRDVQRKNWMLLRSPVDDSCGRCAALFLLCRASHVAVLWGKMTDTVDVSQISYFCTKHLIVCVEACKVRSHWKVCKNAVYYLHTQNGPKIESGTMDISHPQQMPYWWRRGKYVTNFPTFEMVAGHYSRGFSHTSVLATVNVTTLQRCKLYMFLHWAPLCILLSASRR